MTSEDLARKLLHLALDCDADGRDMTAAALRNLAADVLEPHYSATTRAAMGLINQITNR